MNIAKVFNKVKDFIRVPYYCVPPCPCCNSPITGRYILSHNLSDDQWVTTDALKHGEIVEAVPEIPVNNVFCMECGFEWKQKISVSFVSMNQVRHEKMQRLTYELLKEKDEEEIREEEQKLLEKARKKKHRGKLF